MAHAIIFRLARICSWAAVTAMIVMMLMTCWDIFSRQVFGSPVHGVVELVEVTVLICAMLGLPEVFLRDEQIQVDLIDSFLPARVLLVVKAVALVLSTLLLGLLVKVLWQPMLDARLYGDVKYEIGLQVWYLHALTILAMAVSGLATLYRLSRVFAPNPEEPKA